MPTASLQPDRTPETHHRDHDRKSVTKQISGALREVTVVIITYNEIANIGRTLDSLRWARRILVIDSGSTDGTVEAIAGYSNAEVHFRAFDSFARQCNYGLGLASTEWILSPRRRLRPAGGVRRRGRPTP